MNQRYLERATVLSGCRSFYRMMMDRDDTNFNLVPELLRTAMAKQGIYSIKRLADRSRMARSTVVYVLTRESHPSLKILAYHAAFLGWTPEKLSAMLLLNRKEATEQIRKRLMTDRIHQHTHDFHKWIYGNVQHRALKTYNQIFVETVGVPISLVIEAFLSKSELQEIASLSILRI